VANTIVVLSIGQVAGQAQLVLTSPKARSPPRSPVAHAASPGAGRAAPEMIVGFGELQGARRFPYSDQISRACAWLPDTRQSSPGASEVPPAAESWAGAPSAVLAAIARSATRNRGSTASTSPATSDDHAQ
jgi:hypothetical protein